MSKFIMIKEARCSFPRVYREEVKESGDSYGTGITLVLEKAKHAEVLAEIKDAMREAIAGNSTLKKKKPKPDNMCLRKPDREELLYKEGNLILKANSPRPPMVLEADGRTVMTEATDKIYSGCYVNAKVEIWGQANQHGRRVNAKLIAVQFVPKTADSFDGSFVSPEEAVEGFESLDDELATDGLAGDASPEVDVGDDDDLLA